MPQACKSSTEAPKQISIRLACVLIAGMMLLSSLITGLVCWKLASDAAENKAAAQMQERLQNNDVSRTLTYQRLVDGWTGTLADIYGDVIFYGDSLTAEGAWQEYFPYLTTVNLGVVGDSLNGVKTRLPQLEALMCEKCFLMIGVNNLLFGETVESILQEYENLLQQMAQMSSDLNMRVYVQSVLPVRENDTIYEVYNADICRLNEGIKELAEQFDMPYIDVHSVLKDQDGSLEINYSKDGLHLNELGYEEWQKVLIPYLDE